MKTLYESLLDAEEPKDTVVWFHSLMNVKSQEEFDNLCEKLKNLLDNELGKDYDKAFNRLTKYPRGKSLCIVASGDHWVIYVSKTDIYKSQLSWNPRKNRVEITYSSIDLYSYLKLHQADIFYLYGLNGEWNNLRDLINQHK